jgi:hypothetical protein
LLDLVEDDADLILVAGEAIDRIGDHDVDCAGPQQLANAFDPLTVEREAAGRLPNRLDDEPGLRPREVQAGPLLGLQRGAVPLLGIS